MKKRTVCSLIMLLPISSFASENPAKDLKNQLKSVYDDLKHLEDAMALGPYYKVRDYIHSGNIFGEKQLSAYENMLRDSEKDIRRALSDLEDDFEDVEFAVDIDPKSYCNKIDKMQENFDKAEGTFFISTDFTPTLDSMNLVLQQQGVDTRKVLKRTEDIKGKLEERQTELTSMHDTISNFIKGLATLGECHKNSK